MATLLKFKQGDSGTELNLNTGSTGFTLEENGWNLAVATPVHMGDPPPVLERLDLLLSNTSYNNLASNMQSLHEMQVLANRYINDPTQENPVWLHTKMDGETGERRALVRSITMQYKAPWFGAGQSTTNIPLVLTVVRGPYWENPVANNFPALGSRTGACVTYDYTTSGTAVDPNGDFAGRVRFFEIDSTDPIQKIWMGLRSSGKHGATGISNFETIWECEDGTNDPDNVESGITDAVDTTASGGDRVQLIETDVDWDDGSWRRVLKHTLTQASTNEEDQFGDFLWLLRAKVSSASTWEVYLLFHFNTGGIGAAISKDIVEVNDQDWKYYEMGKAPISLRNIQAIIDSDWSKSVEGDYTVSIYARRRSGSSSLYLDCIIPLPADEGFIKLDWQMGGTGWYKAFGQSPKGEWNAIVTSATAVYAILPGPDSVNNFSIPPGDGRIYCVFERHDASGGTKSDITDEIDFNGGESGKYYERWLSLRGSE